MESILKYFPNITEKQKEQFAALYDLYFDWNSKINVISRKDPFSCPQPPGWCKLSHGFPYLSISGIFLLVYSTQETRNHGVPILFLFDLVYDCQFLSY